MSASLWLGRRLAIDRPCPWAPGTLPWLSLFAVLPLLAGGCDAGDSVAYRGEINAEANQRFFAQVARRPPRRLVIDSPGGEVEAGIALGRWVFAQGVDLVVEGECLSSCANYVFTAARRKTVQPGAVVGWHGNYHHLEATGLWRDDVAARVARTGEAAATAEQAVRAQVARLVALEKEFFATVGVDERLCWIGKLPPFDVPNYYTLSAADMARFGVFGVSLPGDYPAKHDPDGGAAIPLIRLEHSARGIGAAATVFPMRR
jgi:hypothetical protein